MSWLMKLLDAPASMVAKRTCPPRLTSAAILPLSILSGAVTGGSLVDWVPPDSAGRGVPSRFPVVNVDNIRRSGRLVVRIPNRSTAVDFGPGAPQFWQASRTSIRRSDAVTVNPNWRGSSDFWRYAWWVSLGNSLSERRWSPTL